MFRQAWLSIDFTNIDFLNIYWFLNFPWNMVGWHHRINGHEFEKTLGDGEGQGSLACCSSWSQTWLSKWTTNHTWEAPYIRRLSIPTIKWKPDHKKRTMELLGIRLWPLWDISTVGFFLGVSYCLQFIVFLLWFDFKIRWLLVLIQFSADTGRNAGLRIKNPWALVLILLLNWCVSYCKKFNLGDFQYLYQWSETEKSNITCLTE